MQGGALVLVCCCRMEGAMHLATEQAAQQL